MIKQNRPKAPNWLTKDWLKWGVAFHYKRSQNSDYVFQWRTIRGEKVNILLRQILLDEMTFQHCSFCDGFPIEATSQATIEHFKPKSKYPIEVYAWHNLYIACNKCQEKNDNFDNRLLRPDAAEYDFYDYFLYNAATGEIEINPSADIDAQERAEITIDLYKLNADGRTAARKAARKSYLPALSLNEISIEDCPYRFMFI
jgi:uncharacterized protein (TIGR02646 family)